jgi:hypothetical protein
VRVGEQNLYIRAKELVGDRNPREEEFSLQMRPMDADKTGPASAFPSLSPCAAACLDEIHAAAPSLSGLLISAGPSRQTLFALLSSRSTSRRKHYSALVPGRPRLWSGRRGPCSSKDLICGEAMGSVEQCRHFEVAQHDGVTTRLAPRRTLSWTKREHDISKATTRVSCGEAKE